MKMHREWCRQAILPQKQEIIKALGIPVPRNGFCMIFFFVSTFHLSPHFLCKMSFVSSEFHILQSKTQEVAKSKLLAIGSRVL